MRCKEKVLSLMPPKRTQLEIPFALNREMFLLGLYLPPSLVIVSCLSFYQAASARAASDSCS